jgi:hypothetical protein
MFLLQVIHQIVARGVDLETTFNRNCGRREEAMSFGHVHDDILYCTAGGYCNRIRKNNS